MSAITTAHVVQMNRELRAKVAQLEGALREIATEPCHYRVHEGDPHEWDPECPGAECWAKKALATPKTEEP